MSQLVGCQSITKSYGAKALFQEFSFGISSEERLGIIGPNGSGKTTLLRIIAQTDYPDSGEVSFCRGLQTAYLSQRDSFADGITIEQLLQAALAEKQLDHQQLQQRIAKVQGIFGSVTLSTPASELSGGWRKRLAIACEVVKEPDLLLLDEPTNHLDLEGIQWLEDFLAAAPFAVITVSHDRTFLENVANRVLEINPRFPKGYFAVEGNYSRFLEKREDYLTAVQRHEESLANRVRREVEWLRRGPKARGTKASARIDEAERLITELGESRSRSRQKESSDIDFTPSGRRTKRLLTVEGISKAFEGKELFKDLELVLSPGSRVGLLGANGSGKTTLLNILSGRLQPDEGTLDYAPQLKTVFFDQARKSLDPELTLSRALAPESDSVIFQGRSIHVASYASRFLFRGESLNQPVGSLSGGEQARLLIARLMLEPADILLLDEPTNDLDIDTLEVLEDSLEEFAGAVVLVTHDRLMLNRICSVLIGLESGKEATVYADYSQWLSRDRPLQGKGEKKERVSTPRVTQSGQPKKLSYKEKFELEQIEEKIVTAEEKLERCQREVQEPTVASDGDRMKEACLKLDEAQRTVDKLYERWAELTEKQG